jgi:hypothetical protein
MFKEFHFQSQLRRLTLYPTELRAQSPRTPYKSHNYPRKAIVDKSHFS